MRTFMDKPIKKETVSLGVGGQITRDDDFPELPPRARVQMRLEADYNHVKHKFLDNGGVEEILILTIDADSVEVLTVSEPPVQEELPVTDEEPSES
jgi:hypothetical protein